MMHGMNGNRAQGERFTHLRGKEKEKDTEQACDTNETRERDNAGERGIHAQNIAIAALAKLDETRSGAGRVGGNERSASSLPGSPGLVLLVPILFAITRDTRPYEKLA